MFYPIFYSSFNSNAASMCYFFRISLEDKIMELHKVSMSQNRQEFTEDEKRLLQFHLSNLEYACGAPISEVQLIMKF